jgi:hypothetical protein
MTAMTQLVGGHFQDSQGNLLANGYLEMALNQDATVPGVCNVAAGITVRIQLDAFGNVAAVGSTTTGPNQYVWGNDNLSPVNTFYTVTGYTAQGQTAFGPNNQQVKGPSPFDVGTWIPNLVISWVPSTQGVTLETNGTPNIFQNLLNLFAGTGIILTDEGNGTVEISSTAASLALEVDSVPALSQTLLNLESTDASVLITDLGGGNINFQTPGASVPAGNILFFMPGQSPTGGSGFTNAAYDGGYLFGGDTAVVFTTGRALINAPSKFTVTINIFTGPVTLSAGSKFVVAKVVQDTAVVVSTTPITFGGFQPGTLPQGISTSDVITLTFDAIHDYYFMWYIVGTNIPVQILQSASGMANMEGGTFLGWTGDHTSDNPILLGSGGSGASTPGQSWLIRILSA